MAKNEKKYKTSILAGIDLFDDNAKPAVEEKVDDYQTPEPQKAEPAPQPVVYDVSSTTYPEQREPMISQMNRRSTENKEVRSFRTCVYLSQDLRNRARRAQDAGLFYSLNNVFNILLDEYLKKNGF